MAPSEWGPRGWWISQGLLGCEGGTGHAPGGRARNHCAPFLAIFHLYTSENLVQPGYLSIPGSLHPFCTRWDELAMYGSAQTALTPLHCSHTPLFAVLLLFCGYLVSINSGMFDFLKFKWTVEFSTAHLSLQNLLSIIWSEKEEWLLTLAVEKFI